MTLASSIGNGAVLSGEEPWTAIVTGNEPDSVAFSIDGTVQWTENYSPYQFNGDPDGLLDTTALTNGNHTLTIVASEPAGALSTTSTVRVSNIAPAAVPTPTPAPTAAPPAPPAPGPTPTPAPTAAPPAPTVTSCPSSLQTAINATATNGTLSLPAGCFFREAVTITRSMTLTGYGDTIDGRDTSGTIQRTTWMTISASNVTVAGFTMQYVNSPKSTGGLKVSPGMTNVLMKDLDLSHATSAALSFGGASSSTFLNSAAHDNGQEGIQIGGDSVVGHGVANAVRGSRIYNNNSGDKFSPEDEAGGLKATVQTNLVLDGNEVYGNHGPGLWCDIYCRGTTYSNNRVHDNTYAGIMEEVSYNARITGNASWHNGYGKNVWGWGCGILVSSSTGTVVDHNTVAWNARSGISIISQNRQDWPAVKPIAGIYVHDNVTAVSISNTYGEFWGEDFSGTMFAASQNNRGAGERYWFSYPENGNWRFVGSSSFGYLSDFAKTVQATGSTYITTAQKDSLLSAAGIPTNPY